MRQEKRRPAGERIAFARGPRAGTRRGGMATGGGRRFQRFRISDFRLMISSISSNHQSSIGNHQSYCRPRPDAASVALIGRPPRGERRAPGFPAPCVRKTVEKEQVQCQAANHQREIRTLKSQALAPLAFSILGSRFRISDWVGWFVKFAWSLCKICSAHEHWTDEKGQKWKKR